MFETDPPAGTEVPLDQLITIYVYVAGPDTGTETPGG